MGETNLYIFGASGHGKVVQSIAQALGLNVVAFLDDNNEISQFSGLEVIHEYDKIQFSSTDYVVIAIGVNKIREKIVSKLSPPTINLIHPHSLVEDTVFVGEGIVACKGSMVQVDTTIGNYAIVNTGASIDHDCEIGDFVHVAPNSTICGGVKIGSHTWVGAGAVISQYLTIGKNVMIGAGAVVIKDIPDNAVVVGNPAKIIKYQ